MRLGPWNMAAVHVTKCVGRRTVMRIRCLLVLSSLLTFSPLGLAQPPVLPPGDKEPVLRLEAGGPTGFVTALTFSPDGKTLYAAGFDKVVRVWNLNAQTG